MIAAVAFLALTSSPQLPSETPAAHDARMKWWREARFGMFIHWGLYAIPAGKWGDNTGHGEWIRETAHIPLEEYNKFQPQFNPTKFNADAWARMAKNAGMKYMVLTSKHHDGFALFDSKLTDWDVMNTPFKRDIVRELAQACRRHGVRFGVYHSIMDWHHPDYLPRRGWETAIRPAAGADFNRFNAYLQGQVRELLTNYGDLAVLWFDGEWESTWNDSYGRPLYNMCRELQPKIIVNNRVSNNRGGSMEDEKKPRVGDFATPEQYIPATGLPGVDWETCMTMNDHWGYNAANRNWKSTKELVRNLVDVASKGGNYLLNIGPKADGMFPQESIDRLREMGSWMRVNGESIYGTTASPFRSLAWGRATRRGNRLYLHVFEWPRDGRLTVPGVATTPTGAKLLGGGSLKWKADGPNLIINLPRKADPIDGVVAVDFGQTPVVYPTPTLSTASDQFITQVQVKVEREMALSYRYTLDGTAPKWDSAQVRGPVVIDRDATLRVAGFSAGRQVTEEVSRNFRKATPWPALTVAAPRPGVLLQEYNVALDRLTGWKRPENSQSSLVDSFAPVTRENVARVYSGLIYVPADDLYTFELTADDGAVLRIGDQMVVDNDGLHVATTKAGYAPLAKGYHRFELSWFNRTGGSSLSLKMGKTGETPALVNPAQLSHEPL